MLRSLARGSGRRPLSIFVTVLLSLFWLSAGPLVAPASANGSGNVLFGGFEIDGNFYVGTDNTTIATSGTNLDWGSASIKSQVGVVQDPFGVANDPTIYDTGSKENNLASWADTSSAQPPGKGDIGNLYTYSHLVGGDQYLYLAFVRDTSSGSVTYAIELNQKSNTTNANGATIPDRTTGDLRITVSQNGSGVFQVASVEQWSSTDASFHAVSLPAGSYALAVNDSTISIGNPTPAKWTPSTVGVQQFLEVGFNLSALGVDLSCPSTGFSSAFLRSRSSPSESSELKDYTTGPISVPSDCSQFQILKTDKAGNLLPGATFSISPNPFPGTTAPDPVNVKDGGVGDADGLANGVVLIKPAKPGTYTIAEVTPPDGYVGTSTTQKVVAEPYAQTPASVTFVNRLGSLGWAKTDSVTGKNICGATFSLDRVKDAAGTSVSDAAVSIVDNCGQSGYPGLDENAAAGEFLVSSLKTGTYELKEIQAPTGYAIDISSAKSIVINSTTQTSGGTFTDTRRTVDVTLPKLFEGQSTTKPGVSADFTLYKDADKSTTYSVGDSAITTVATDAEGKATFTGLAWGPDAYYVIRETMVPAGFSAVADIAFNLVAFPSGGTLTLSAVTDPRKTVNVTLPKAFEGEVSPYAVQATFKVYADTNNNKVLDSSEISAGALATEVTGTDGVATFTGLAWGTNAHYIVHESTVPTGFTAIPDIAFDLTAYPDGGTYNLAALNNGKAYVDHRDLAAVTLNKLGRNLDGGTSPLTGSVFTLCSESGADPASYNAGADTPCVVPTSGAGTDSMSWSKLAWGSGKVYWLVETSAPAGYQPVAPIKVDLSDFPQGGTKTVTATDERQTVTVDLAKQDGGPTAGTSGDNSILGTAWFTLFRESGANTGYQATEDKAVAKAAEQVGPDGTITWSGLSWGPGQIYYAVETTTPTGYVTVQPQTVDLTSFPKGGTYSIGTLVDERLPFQVKLTKFDSGYGTTPIPLAGAGFTLYTNVGCDVTVDSGDLAIGREHVSASDGSVPPWTGLAWGRCYLLSETTVPLGYSAVANILVDSTSGYPEGGTLTYDANDPRLLASIVVVKHDGSVQGPTLAGAWFELRDTSGNVVRKAVSTGENGTISFTGLEWGKTYVVHETTAPQGYDLVSDKTVDLNTYPLGGVVTVDIPDPKLPATVTLVKKDGFDGSYLTSAKFTLYAESGATEGFQSTQDTMRAGGPASMVDGKITFTGLVWGPGETYYAVETSTPTGYATVAPITVDLTSYPEGGTYAIGDVVDNRLPVTLNLLKLGTSPGDTADINLAGVGFTLYRDTAPIGVLDAQDAPVGTEHVTAADGSTSWTGLSWGGGQRYLLHESTPKPGYATVADQVIDLTAYPANGQGTVSYTLTDFRQQAELTVRKTGGDAALAGAQFALYRDNGNGQFSATSDTVVGGCTTASAGLCSVTVDWGSSYFWYEKTAPAGYNLPTTQWQGPIAVTAANVTTTFPVTSFNDTRTGVTTTPSAGPVVIAPQPGTSGSVQTMFDSATLTGLSRDATGTVTFQLFGPFTGAAAVTCDATPAFISSGNAISLVGSSGAFVATSAVFTPKAAGLYQWRAIYTGDAKNAGITGTCPDATEQATVQAGPGPRVAKVADPATGSVVQPGSTITYTVTVSNVGDVPIVNGPVVDTLPANVTAVAGSVSDGGTVSADGRTVNWSVDLAAGASKQLTYKVTVDVGAPPGADLVNRVVFFDQQATTTHRTPTGNLTIVKSNSPTGTVAYGDSITYTMTVSATGTLDQPGVVVTDYVPGFDPADTTSLKTTYTAGSASCDGTCPTPTYAAGQLTWSLGTILAGTSRTVSFTVTVDRPTPAADGSIPGGDVRNVAVASSTLTPPTPSNQVVNAVTAVPATPTGALSITKANDPTGTVARGDRITYTLTVTASGTLTQTNVIVTDMVPGFDPADTTSLPTTYVDGSATCSGCSLVGYDATTHQVSWSLGDMAGGTSQTVSFAVTVDPVAAGTAAAAGEVRNTALVQSGQTAPTRSNQVVNGVAEVLGVKIAQPAPKVEGVKIAAPVATLPRTGPVAPLGATLWLAGMLLTVGLGLTVVGSRSRRRAQHRS